MNLYEYKKNTGHFCPVSFVFVLLYLFTVKQNFVCIIIAYITCSWRTIHCKAYISNIQQLCIMLDQCLHNCQHCQLWAHNPFVIQR